MPDAFRQLLSTIYVKPNAGRQAPPIAAARDERRLLAVACTPLLGAVLLSYPGLPYPSSPCEAPDALKELVQLAVFAVPLR